MVVVQTPSNEVHTAPPNTLPIHPTPHKMLVVPLFDSVLSLLTGGLCAVYTYISLLVLCYLQAAGQTKC